MPAQFTLPPDTRSVGSGNPPADMNSVVDAITAMGAGLNILNAAFAGGADPGGTNDSTAAIQAAINAQAGPVDIPPGHYLVNTGGVSITLLNGTVLRGAFAGTYPGTDTIPGISYLSRAAGANCDVLLAPDGNNVFRIYDLAIDGNKNNNTAGYGLHVADGAAGQECQAILERCYFHDNPYSNLYLGHNRRANKVISSVFNYSGTGDGITTAGSDNIIRNNIMGTNGRAGICLGTTITQNWAASASPNAAAVEHVIDNDIYGNLVGIALGSSTSDCMVMGNGIDRNSYQGLTVYDGDSNVIEANSFHSNGTLTTNTYGHIDVGIGVSQVGINNNNFGPLDAGITNVASYAVNYGGATGGIILGNIGVADATATVGGLINSVANATPYTLIAKSGAVIQGSGNDILNVKNSSGSLISKITNGGSLVHSGGALQLTGHFIALLSTTPGVNNGTYCTGVAIGADSSDIGGLLSATMVASPAAGTLISVTFHTAYGNVPAVTITPTNIYAAQIQTYVTVIATGFTIYAATAPPAGVDSQAVSWDYVVIGQNA